MSHQTLLFTLNCLHSEPCDHTDSICEYILLVIYLVGPVSTRRLDFDIFNNTLQTANKGWSSMLSVMRVVNTFVLQTVACYKELYSAQQCADTN